MLKGHSAIDTDLGWTELFNSLSMPLAMLRIQTNQRAKLLRSNKAFQQLFALKPTSRAQGFSLLPKDFVRKFRLLAKGKTTPDWCYQTAQGDCRHFKLLMDPVTDTSSADYLLVMQDVTEQEKALVLVKNQNEVLEQRLFSIERLKNRIKEQSIRDPLTNLYNRRFLNEFMERELALARRNQKPLAVVMLDLDHFKQLNDQFGHQFGDSVLQRVADILAVTFTRGQVYRFGGDEFACLFPLEDKAELVNNLNRLLDTIRLQQWREKQCRVTLSIGIAIGPKLPQKLFESADAALYRSKAAGRDCWHLG